MKILFDFAIFITMFSSTIANPLDTCPCDESDESELSTTTGETFGDRCASQGEICKNGEGRTIRHGQIRIGDSSKNQYSNWRNPPYGGFVCSESESEFGMDPSPGRGKSCWWRLGPSASETKANEAKETCEKEGINCFCPMQQARYGEGERWTNWIDVKGNGNIMCNSDSFGGFDPAPGRYKECECRPIPTLPPVIEYQGRWVEAGLGLNQFSVKATVSYEESVSKTVGEVFVEGYGVSTTVTVGYESPGATGGSYGSVSVTAEMSRSYEQSTSYTMKSVDKTTNEVLCGAEVCDGGVLYQWEVLAFDQFSKVAATVRTCKFVCVPYKKSDGSKVFPVCPETACNYLEKCTCCAVKWSDDTDVDQKLCADTACSYTDGPNADNSGHTCDNWIGTLEEAKSRCTAESTCSYLHDWNGDGTNWRTCSEITVPGDGGAATKTKTCPDTVCSYTDGPNADNDGRTCDNWSGTLEEAKSRCTAESTCSYLHDWGDNGTNWRTCSEITVPGDGGAATKTKTCHNRRHLQDEGTAESAFDVSVDTATLSNSKLVGDTSRRRRRLGGTKSAILLA